MEYMYSSALAPHGFEFQFGNVHPNWKERTQLPNLPPLHGIETMNEKDSDLHEHHTSITFVPIVHNECRDWEI